MLKRIKRTWWIIWTAAYLEAYGDGKISRKEAVEAAKGLYPLLGRCKPKTAALVEVDFLLSKENTYEY